MPTVVITDFNFPNLDIERQVFDEANVDMVSTQAQTPDDVIQVASDNNADALLVQYADITPAVFESLGNLQIVAKYGIGTDNIDKESATNHGVPVLNVPTYCQDEVAEHAIGLLFSCERKFPLFDGLVKSGTWDWKQGKPIHRLTGKTVGVVGCGRIGTRFIEKTRGFEFDLLGYDPNISIDNIDVLDVESVGFRELLKRSDIVTAHVPLTSQTERLFDKNAFQRMKSNAILINTARGPVVDTEALYEALVSGEIRGAGLDVLPEEPPQELPLFDRDDVVLTPHTAWYSEESISVLRETVARDIVYGLSGEVPENIVNEEVIGASD